MIRTARLLGPILLIALAGCGTRSTPMPPAQPAMAVTQTAEAGGRFVALAGPRLQHAEPFLGVPGTNFYLLRSLIDTRSGAATHQLYLEDSYFGAERNWNMARDANGQALRMIPISKNEITCANGCSYAEEVAAVLPDALLRASPQGLPKEITITFSARSGAQKAITLPGDLIARQLAAVDEVRATLPAAAAAPRPAPQP